MTGQPAASVPMGFDETGVPVGAQLAAAFGREDVLFALSAQLEQARPWSTEAVWPPEPGATTSHLVSRGSGCPG